MVGAIGIVSMLIALTFAEVASRFEGTGGPYLYTKAAFGRFAGFEVGWMLWFTRVASWAAIINVLVWSLGFYWPGITVGLPRAILITTIIVILAAINIRGIRQSSFVVNGLTIGKLLPLAIFIVTGLLFVKWGRLEPGPIPSATDLSATGLLLIYAFGGYEIVPVPGGEARNPRRDIPFALMMTIVIVTAVMTLAQIVAVGTLPDLSASKTPLADASAVFLGAGGAAMITIGAVISVTGASMGGALSGSRNLFALAEQGDLPALFGYVHPRFRTPVVAILITSSVTLTLALTGTFQSMATVSAISRLVVYVGTCVSTLRLRSRRFEGVVNPPVFVVPLGASIPIAAIVIALAVLGGASSIQLRNGGLALIAGAVLYLVSARGRSRAGSEDPALRKC
jgi:amino acid transporter